MIWILYVDGEALATFLDLKEAVESLFLFVKDGRRVGLVRKRG